jgi:peptidoglycan/LPS O-acetylase OafA/YrhL
MIGLSFALQILILEGQHITALLPYPASTALWYIGSLIPGAWIGLNWENFKSRSVPVSVFLGLLTSIGFALFLGCQFGSKVNISLPEYLENFALTLYASCASILVLLVCFSIVKSANWTRPIEFLGRFSLQIYLIHPLIIVLLAKRQVVGILNQTYFGPLLSPLIMLTITLLLIFLIRVLRLEKLLFGNSPAGRHSFGLTEQGPPYGGRRQ